MQSSVQKIFVNRSIQMSKIKCIGFDMDATLAIYNSPASEEIAFDLIKSHLVKKMDYPGSVEQLKFDASFPIRGCWYDRIYGLLLKMDECGNILSAWKGLKRLSSAEIREIYPNKHIRLDEERFMTWTTVFHLPEIALLASVIDLLDRSESHLPHHGGYKIGESRQLTYRAIQADLRAATNYVHESGLLKSAILADLPRYIAKDTRAVSTIRALGEAGKSVFLLTNSPYKFSDAVMSFMMGPDWRSLFDVVIVEGNKPNWFTGKASFKEVDPTTGLAKLGDHFGPLEKGIIYAGGNAFTFRHQMKRVGKDLLYVGDHIIGDVLVSKRITGWRTLLIVPELDRELKIWQQQEKKLVEMRHNFIDSEDAYRDPSEVKRRLGKIAELTDSMEAEYGQMGSTLRCGWRHTYYGGKVRRYADLYTGNVYNMLDYMTQTDHYFHAPMTLFPHERSEETVEECECTKGLHKGHSHSIRKSA